MSIDDRSAPARRRHTDDVAARSARARRDPATGAPVWLAAAVAEAGPQLFAQLQAYRAPASGAPPVGVVLLPPPEAAARLDPRDLTPGGLLVLVVSADAARASLAPPFADAAQLARLVAPPDAGEINVLFDLGSPDEPDAVVVGLQITLACPGAAPGGDA